MIRVEGCNECSESGFVFNCAGICVSVGTQILRKSFPCKVLVDFGSTPVGYTEIENENNADFGVHHHWGLFVATLIARIRKGLRGLCLWPPLCGSRSK